MNTQLDIIFFSLVGILFLIIGFWAFSTERRLKRFFLGKKAKDLEETIEHLENNINSLTKAKADIENELKIVNAKLRKAIRGLGTIRFNPFPDQGSNQSFAIGMLDEDGDGVVVSSLYSRDRMSVFAKPVKNGKPLYELTEEEREALDQAKVN